MTAFTLKIIAVITMLLDHTYVVFPLTFPLWFRFIGRIAFPVFAYMIAQGCKHTSNINKYVLRLGIFALVSEVPFDIAFLNEISFINDTNIFYTLFLGAACIAVFEKIRNKLSDPEPNGDSTDEQVVKSASGSKSTLARAVLPVLPILPIALLGNLLGTDYGTLGVACILVFYFAKPENRLTRTLAATCIIIYMYGDPRMLSYLVSYVEGISASNPIQDAAMSIPPDMLNYFLFALISVLLVLLYNGKQGSKVKWAFYAFYPVHLAILAAIRHIAGQG